MGSIMDEERQLEHGDSSLLISLPKRRKVSAVRDFPYGCGPNAASVCEQTKPKGVQGLDGLNVDNVLKEVLKDIESCGELGGDLCEAERNEQMVQPHGLNGVELEASNFAYHSEGKCRNEDLNHLSAENLDKSEEVQFFEETPILRDEKHGASSDTMGARLERPTISKTAGELAPKELGDAASNQMDKEGASAEQLLLPHYPIPSHHVCKERKYPTPRKVSAVRDFPAGCGRHLTISVKNCQVVEVKTDTKMDEAGVVKQNGSNLDGDENCEDKIHDTISRTSLNPLHTHENRSEADKGVAVKMIKEPMLGQSSEIVGGEKQSEDNNHERLQDMEELKYGSKDENDVISLPDRLKNDLVVYEKKKSDGPLSNNIELHEVHIADTKVEKGVTVLGLMSAASCPWRQMKKPAKSSPSLVSAKGSKRKKFGNDARHRQKRSLTKSKDNADEDNADKLPEKSMMIVPYHNEREACDVPQPLALTDDEYSSENEEHNDFQFLPRPRDCEVTLPPSGMGSSSVRGARSKVRETLRLFQVLVRKLLQGEETKSKEKRKTSKRVDTRAANFLRQKGKYINTDKVIGAVPGVEVGDIFGYRVELAIIGLHSPLQSGIDTIKQGKVSIATSVVASGGYDNDVDSSDVLIYTGQGGNPTGPDKEPEDQKLERGNLALKNCIDLKNPVRVIRGFKESKPADNGDGRSKLSATYTYDGLYTVESYWQDLGPHGKLVYKFELKRIPGQHQLAWKEVKQSKKCKVREGSCVDDISNGEEKAPICAVNTINDEKPPPFTYITSMMYPDWCRPLPLQGCDCVGGCSDSDRCTCTIKNGVEIPYNFSGAIVEAKPLVYECGPSCKCLPSCPNRVSQHGIRLPLEIFKTESRGWGVRSLSPITSGSFICEYIGELLDDKEAEQRAGSDEYLFDIGQNFNNTTLSDGLSDLMPEMPSVVTAVVENIGFTIDAARYGNIGRFINHSCSPNLYAQNVLYDHEDKRIPHIMLFAAENIPPLQELTYHYNYTIDQVFDSEGNIKKKDCYCGSAECSCRMY